VLNDPGMRIREKMGIMQERGSKGGRNGGRGRSEKEVGLGVSNARLGSVGSVLVHVLGQLVVYQCTFWVSQECVASCHR
jgi:hypothetical protein